MSKYTIEEKYEFLCNQMSLTVSSFGSKDGTLEMKHIGFLFDKVPETADDAVEQAMTYLNRRSMFETIKVWSK